MKNSTHKFSSSSSNKTMKKSIKKSRKKPIKKYKGGFSRQYNNHYLEDVKGIDEHKDTIYNKSFGEKGVQYFVEAKKDIFESKNILDLSKKNVLSKKEWTSCNTQCRALLNNYIKKEIESTAFFLRILANSIISTVDGAHVQFSINDVGQLSGKWENDMQYFNIVYVGNSEDDNKISGRLIMGFGPSASGKTYWAKNVINMFSMIYKDVQDPVKGTTEVPSTSNRGYGPQTIPHNRPTTFPKSFLTIDGGLYRECSQIYQFIVRSILDKGHGGLSNLVPELFSSDKIKDGVVTFLKQQRKQHIKVPISLYVPDTLKCMVSCDFIYKKYIEITDDKAYWIGLNIYQHNHALDCTYAEEFKCTGCSESGMMRQHKEGKKYSNKAWGNSYRKGNSEILKAPGGSFLIHNSGGKKWFPPSRKGPELCKSIITDQSKNSLFDKKMVPVIEKEFHCVYLRESPAV